MFSIMLIRLGNSRPKSIEADVVFELIQRCSLMQQRRILN